MMPDDFKNQLRALVDATPPVSSREAVARAEACPAALRSNCVTRRRGYLGRSAAVAASAVVLASAGAGIGWTAASSSSPMHTANPVAVPRQQPKVILTAAEVRAITARSTAAATSSGTAEVTQISRQNGVPQDGYNTAVMSSGQNIDEKITSVPEPPGSGKSVTTDDRLIGGQFYIYTPGPNDVLEWMHDTNSANDAASMQFPDPRTLYRAISPAARFAVDGTTTAKGQTVTRLVARAPSAISSPALGNLAADATVTSFAIWVDTSDVVQKIALSTSTTAKVCKFGPLTSAQLRQLRQAGRQTITHPNGTKTQETKLGAIRSLLGRKNCGPMTTASNVTVTFADLGTPKRVTAPRGAIGYRGQG
jgi:hypothetical protein